MGGLLHGIWRVGDGLGMDLRLAVRSLGRTRGFTCAALASLALGIGGNTALFSVVHATFLRPVPGVVGPERVVELLVTTRARSQPEWAYPDLADVAADETPLEAVAGWKVRQCSFGTGERGERVRVMYAESAYFPVLGVRMALGRGFLPPEDVGPGQHPVVVLGHKFWQALGGRADIVGQSITLNRQPYTVVGVAPEAFRHHRPTAPAIDLWAPLTQYPDVSGPKSWSSDRSVFWVEALGRLRPGATVGEASAALGTIFTRLAGEYPGTNRERGARAEAFGPLPARSRTEDTVLMGSLLAFGGLVLLIICANLAGMMLARGAAQQGDVAVRIALGAGRGRLARRFLVDAAVLASGGGVVGTVTAWWCTSLPAFGAFVGLPEVDLGPGRTVLGFTVLLVLATALAVGLLPAVRLTRARAIALNDDTGTGGRRAGRFHRVAVSSQVAVAVAFMAVSGVFVRSLSQLDRRDLGFDPERLLVVSMDLSTQGYEDSTAVTSFVDRVQESVGALPGVMSAAVADGLPIDAVGNFTGVSRTDRPDDDSSQVLVEFTRAGGGFFRTIGARVLRGRGLEATDTATSERVVVVSRSLAERLWPNEDALGKQVRLRFGLQEKPTPHTVVGVTADVASSRPTENWPQIFVSLAQHADRPRLLLLVKARGDAAALARPVQAAILSADPRLVFPSALTSRSLIARSLEMQRTTAAAAAGLGAVALCLSAFGIYGLVAFVVSRRTREFGLRMALGATQGRILGAILGEGIRLAAPGLVVGAIAAAGLTFAVQSMLLGTAPLDPGAFCLTALVALGVVLLACAVPASRAAHVDPAVALRTE